MRVETAIPILLYHRLGRPPAGARIPGQFVSPRLFRRHLAFLRARGYQCISLTDIISPHLPAKPFVITFDDGYRSLYDDALPALVEFGYPATIFMTTGGLDKENYWETAIGDAAQPMLHTSDLREMRQAGLTFGAHTVNHPHLTACSPETVRREFADAKARLEDLLGEPCLTLAYPYGEWNQSVLEEAAAAGYTLACTTRRAVARPEDDPLLLPRLNIRRYNVIPRFAYKLWQARRRRG